MARRALVVLAMLLPALARAAPDEPIAVAILFNSQHVDGSAPEDGEPVYPQLHEHLRAALDRAKLDDFPAGSQVVIVGYDDGARVIATVPVDRLSGDALGPADGYRGMNHIGTDLVLGLETGMAELQKSPLGRRAMIVIGDGNDTNNDVARKRLLELAQRAARAGIHVHPLLIQSPISPMGDVISILAKPRQVTSLAITLDETLRAIRDQPRRASSAWATSATAAVSSGGSRVPWWWLGAGALVVAGAVLLVLRSRAGAA